MSLSTIVIAILNALAALPKIADMLNQVMKDVVTWWVSRQTGDTKSAIMDAMAAGMRATNNDQREAAATQWQSAMSRARVTAD